MIENLRTLANIVHAFISIFVFVNSFLIVILFFFFHTHYILLIHIDYLICWLLILIHFDYFEIYLILCVRRAMSTKKKTLQKISANTLNQPAYRKWDKSTRIRYNCEILFRWTRESSPANGRNVNGKSNKPPHTQRYAVSYIYHLQAN